MPVAPVAPAPPPPAAPAGPARASFGAVLAAHASPQPAPAPAARAALTSLAAVERAQARLDAVLAAARGGRTFTAAELIGLQADAYRYAQTVELASKLVEQGAQSVKQALNTQV